MLRKPDAGAVCGLVARVRRPAGPVQVAMSSLEATGGDGLTAFGLLSLAG